eukprot:TRINITY_DN2262_c0_g1_i1.p1 TRINITY_DN2262_c0_g1~~TRINITY_DN2262_c0_g1_i1.p1  ORF type:complete len:124 (+),score=15.02 TRINITY_DN2262_c0_g1_i1:774-1145(+)
MMTLSLTIFSILSFLTICVLVLLLNYLMSSHLPTTYLCTHLLPFVQIPAIDVSLLSEKFPLLSHFGTCKTINPKESVPPTISPQLDQTAQEGHILFIAGIGMVVVIFVLFVAQVRKPTSYKHL